MPFINTKTTESLSSDKKAVLTTELCHIANDCLGKGENWVMTGFEEQVSLSFQGSTSGNAYVEVKTYGTPAAAGCKQMTHKICSLLERELGISADHVYVAYFHTDQWGWNGNNF
jgi:hypothetical protein